MPTISTALAIFNENLSNCYLLGVKMSQVKKGGKKRQSDTKSTDVAEKKPKRQQIESAVPPVDSACSISNGTVYSDGDCVYSVVLNQTDIAKNNNKYYKIQLIETDDGLYHVFRGWGRVGYNGQNSLNEFSSIHAAINDFAKAYKEKTKNVWNSGQPFYKVPGKYHPIEVDVSATNKAQKVVERQLSQSKLKPKVQELMTMLFDLKSMKQTMLDYNLDIVKLPLGRLSKRQMMDAYQVLTELNNIYSSRYASPDEFIEASNRFYTLMPHNFGMNRAPVINTREMIEEKREMLDNLIQIEVAYNLIKTEGDEVDGENKPNLLDTQYSAMKVELEPLDHHSDEFILIKNYMSNTHAATHNNYVLELKDVFKVCREGENDRYKSYAKLHNRQLLWHGSRRTNFVGILSNGLRIAPMEAPVSGYMFGKGIYFADMVSKSANYCFTDPQNPFGLMLLSEVALGNTHDLLEADYIDKLPNGKHSTKGIGKTQPDPNGARTRADGVVVPMGKPITNKRLSSKLLYNEYIVYDANQVKMQYLLKVEFIY